MSSYFIGFGIAAEPLFVLSFFFSSRRRHTRYIGDWSSDVCSSDLFALPVEEVENIRQAAELHDVGKVAIPDAILDKPGALSEGEWAFIHRHTVIGERIIGAAPALRRIAALVRASHENLDGTGYPDGLAGQQ